jgi:hypothetical protein
MAGTYKHLPFVISCFLSPTSYFNFRAALLKSAAAARSRTFRANWNYFLPLSPVVYLSIT